MEQIDLTKKSLSPDEVRQYIDTIRHSYEHSLSEQKDRIFELREQVKELESKLEVFKSRGRQINQALMAAVAKAEELEQAAKIKYDMEIKSLKLFHAKWLSYYKRIIEKYPIDDELVKLAKFNDNMSEALSVIEKENAVEKEQDGNKEKKAEVKPQPKTEIDKQKNEVMRAIEAVRIQQENSNKNSTVVSVQRDYMAGEVSKDITRRFLLDEDIAKAQLWKNSCKIFRLPE